MRFSINWLSKYVDLKDQDLQELINKIAYQLVDVEEVHNLENDITIDVDSKIITNRSYCFGHRGLAREIAVLLKKDWHGSIKLKNLKSRSNSKLDLKVTVKDQNLCPRFNAVIIKNIKVQESPQWLKQALESIGQRSINNIVDITNYIMFDTGQPIHAYDYNKIKNKEIIVRKAQKAEKIITLDGIERNLDNDILVIADSQDPIAIAGVMGGLESAVSESTKDIVLEIASFHPINIRQTSKKLKLRTDAVTRFEKGPDITNIPNVMQLLIDLVLEICGGEIASDIIDLYYPEKSTLRTENLILEFDFTRIKKLLGFEVDKNFVLDLFKGFGIEVLDQTNNIYKLSIPPYRADIKESADLIEDIGRIYGYQNIPNALPVNYLQPPKKNLKLELLKKVREALTSSGLDEVITYPFISQKEVSLINQEAIPIINPQSLDYAYLRPNLEISLAKVTSLNAKNFNEFGVFEIAKEFHKNTQKPKDYSQDHGESQRPVELDVISACYYIKDNNNLAIFKLKAAIENIFEKLNIKNYKIHSDGNIDINNNSVGEIKLLNQEITEHFDLIHTIPFFKLYISKLLENYSETVIYEEFIKYQGSKLDYSILIPEELTIENLLEKIPQHPWIREFKVQEVYRDKKLGAKKSVLLTFFIQNPNGNITSSEIYDLGVLVEEKLKTIKDLEIRGEGLKKPAGYKPSIILNASNQQTPQSINKVPSNIIVGKILKVEKHPNADKLVICQVQIDKEKTTVQIVTGANNIKPQQSEGLYVPVALIGAYVYSLSDKTPIKIKKSKLRGIESQGMLCSGSELGLDDQTDGIMILNNKSDENIGDILY